MTNKIEQIFFELLRFEITQTELNKDVVSLITPSVLPALFTLSKRHDLAHLIADALKKNGLLPNNSKVSDYFLNELNVSIFRLAKLNYEYECITNLLEEMEIDYLPLKGTVMRKLYPQPFMRTSADVDILIKKQHLEKAVNAIISKLNYIHDATDAYNAIVVSPSGVHVELHFDLIAKYDDVSSNEILSVVWQNVCQINNSHCFKLNDDYFYYYHVAHMARHFLDGGCGVKPFIDVWLLNNKIEFDSDKRKSLLDMGGLTKFENACNLLSQIWFNGKEHTKETLCLQKFVLNGGVFGTNENEVLIKQGKAGGKAKYIISRIFMPLEEMQHRYKALKKCKLLYPFFVVVRCFEVLFKGDSKRITNELKTSGNITDNEQQSTQELLKYLGLK